MARLLTPTKDQQLFSLEKITVAKMGFFSTFLLSKVKVKKTADFFFFLIFVLYAGFFGKSLF